MPGAAAHVSAKRPTDGAPRLPCCSGSVWRRADSVDPRLGEARKKPRVGSGDRADDSSVPQLKIPLPFTLKKQVGTGVVFYTARVVWTDSYVVRTRYPLFFLAQLVDDWERITQIDPNMLVTLPQARMCTTSSPST